MKKLISDVQDVLDEQLAGLAKVRPSLTLHQDPVYIARTGTPVVGEVTLLSGGSSGHGPMHCDYIGQRMLLRTCPGEILASPTPDEIFECAMQADDGEGVLLVTKNYTGDILNFETATELLRDSGIEVTAVVVDNGVAIKDSLYTAGRRGIANTVSIERPVDAAAERGDSLGVCVKPGCKLSNQGHSIGTTLGAYAVSATNKPSFTLADSKIEFDIGIHGGPGINHRPFSSLNQTVDGVFGTLLTNGSYHRTLRFWDYQQSSWQEEQQTKQPPQSGDRVIALVNNPGVTPFSELYGVYNHLTTRCQQAGLTIEHNLTDTYCTSPDMTGFSITLLKVGDETLALWDAPVHTPTLSWGK